jgi:hypothetical protein
MGPNYAENPEKIDENQYEIGGRIIFDPLWMALIHLHLHTRFLHNTATE